MKAIAVIIAIWVINIGTAYVLDDLIRRLDGYQKTWVSGLNTKFVNMTLEDTMKMMGTPLPIKPEDRLP